MFFLPLLLITKIKKQIEIALCFFNLSETIKLLKTVAVTGISLFEAEVRDMGPGYVLAFGPL